MNETIGEHIYEYDNFSFKIYVQDYWTRIYKGQPRKKLYHDYCVMLDIVKKVDKMKLIVDVGVNNGLFAIPTSMLNYMVVGFEPIKSTYKNIERARKENDLQYFYVFDAALSNENGRKEIYVPECTDNASFSADAAIANMKNKVYDTEIVDTIKFDDWIKQHGSFPPIGLIKIDVQGAEYEVLQGMEEYFTNAHDIYIICEYEDHLLKQGHTFEELDELFKSYGFVEQPKILPNDKLWYKQ